MRLVRLPLLIFLILVCLKLFAFATYAATCGGLYPNFIDSNGVPCNARPLNDQPLSGSCTYDQTTYDCPIYGLTCIVKTPLDCGNGVTVCSNGDGYNCNTWCSNTYSSFCTDSERLKMAFEGQFYKTSNCKGCGHPGYPDCPNHTNPFYTGCGTNNNTQACKNLYPDARPECSAYTQAVCLQAAVNACLSNGECNNASGCNSATSTCTNNPCPGNDPNLQCTSDHSCVFQIQQTTPTPTCPALGTASGNTIYQGCQSSCLNVGYYTDGTGLTCPGTQQCCYSLPNCTCSAATDPATTNLACGAACTAASTPCSWPGGNQPKGTFCPDLDNNECTVEGCRPKQVTCVGQSSGGSTYSCLNGTSCPVGYNRNFSLYCSSTQVCCAPGSPIGSCAVTGIVSGTTATARVDNMVSRDIITWSYTNTATATTTQLGANNGPSSSVNLTPGNYRYNATVYCAGCSYSSLACTPWDFSVPPQSTPTPLTPPPAAGTCIVCDNGTYRLSAGNCNSSSANCDASNANQGACWATSSVNVGSSCGACVVNYCGPPPSDAWITVVAKFQNPDGSQYNGAGLNGSWVPLYLGIVRNDCYWNSTWRACLGPTKCLSWNEEECSYGGSCAPDEPSRAPQYYLSGRDGDLEGTMWTYHVKGWNLMSWEIKGAYFANLGWTQQTAMSGTSQFLYPQFPAGFTLNRSTVSSSENFQRNVCNSASGGKDTYCTSLFTLLGDVSQGVGFSSHNIDNGVCSGGYYQVITFTVTPPPAPVPSVFTINNPTTACTGTPPTPSINLSWNASTNATSYDIYRSNDNVTFSYLTTNIGGTNTTYTDSTVIRGNVYYYKIIAVNINGNRTSNIVSATAPFCDSTAPIVTFSLSDTCYTASSWAAVAQPLRVTVSDNESGVSTVKFIVTPVDPPGNPKPPISAYLESGTASSGVWAANIFLSDSARYSIKVSVNNVAGINAESVLSYFTYRFTCGSPWIQTTEGDVHSNTKIDLPP